jgi:hypothetical protein
MKYAGAYLNGQDNFAAKRGYIINPPGVLTAGLVLFWGTAAIPLWRFL